MGTSRRRVHSWRWTGAIALVLRVAWVLYTAREPVGLVDPTFYRTFGITIANGDGYLGFFSHQPSAYFPPGFPYFVGVVTSWQRHLPAPSLPLTMGLVHAVLGTITVLAVGSIAHRWWGTRSAWLAGLVIACWPNLIIHSSVLLSETLYLTLLAVSLWCAVEADHRGRPAAWVGGAGVAFAASVLVRPQGALCGLVLLVVWWAAGRRAVMVRAVAVIAITGAAVTPWLVRNHQDLGSPVMSTNVGDNLCIGNGPGATGHFRLGADCVTEHDYIRDSRSEVLHDDETTDIASAEIRRDPLRQLKLVPTRLWATIVDDHDGLRAAESFGNDHWMPGGLRTTLRWLSDAYWYAVALAATVSVLRWIIRLRTWRPWRWGERITPGDVAILACVVGVGTALVAPLISFGEPRFKIPAVPFLALLVGALVAHALDETRPSSNPPPDGVRPAATADVVLEL